MQTTVHTASRAAVHAGPAPAAPRQLCVNGSTAGHRRTSRTVSAVMNMMFTNLVPCISKSNLSSSTSRADHTSNKVRCCEQNLLLQHHTSHIMSLDDILLLKDEACMKGLVHLGFVTEKHKAWDRHHLLQGPVHHRTPTCESYSICSCVE